MSEITLRYKLSLDDLVNFSEVVVTKKTLSFRILCIVATFVWAFEFIMIEEYIVAMIGVAFLILGVFYPYILRRTLRKQYKGSFMLERETQLEFYNDHIVEKVLPPYEGAYESEMHVPFEKIMNITETDDLFLFFITPIQALGVPKSVFTPEDRKKLFYLIDNVFRDRFTRTNIRKAMKNDKSNNGKRG